MAETENIKSAHKNGIEYKILEALKHHTEKSCIIRHNPGIYFQWKSNRNVKSVHKNDIEYTILEALKHHTG